MGGTFGVLVLVSILAFTSLGINYKWIKHHTLKVLEFLGVYNIIYSFMLFDINKYRFTVYNAPKVEGGKPVKGHNVDYTYGTAPEKYKKGQRKPLIKVMIKCIVLDLSFYAIVIGVAYGVSLLIMLVI